MVPKADVREHETQEDRQQRRDADRSQRAHARAKQKSEILSIDDAIAKFKKQIRQQPVYIRM